MAASALLVVAVGCERSHSDMGEQDKALPYERSAFYPNGTTARPLPAGTVPRDDGKVPGVPYARHRVAGPVAQPQVVAEGTGMPFEVTADVVRRGQVAFDTYCSVCHGRLGNGQGMIVERGFTRPPSFHVERLRNAPDSHFYNVITGGFGAMFSYGDRVAPEERWEIVAYIRALQAAGAQAPAEVRKTLVAAGDRPATVPVGGGQ